MKGDFYRIRFEKTEHYTAEVEQGRVAVDADHNEQRAIDRNLRETETVDIIGPYGGPRRHRRFRHYYIGEHDPDRRLPLRAGILCENEAPLTYAASLI